MGSKKPLGGPKAHAALVAARAEIMSKFGPCVQYRQYPSWDGRTFEALDNAADVIEAVSKHFENPDRILATAWWSYWRGHANEDNIHATAVGAHPMFDFAYFIGARERHRAAKLWSK